ncbi:hypothetical protein EOD41_07225 [Mucilaginibacter limnophilus]|uniref:Uncharacterized protein n=1 Tax=Mucilaginibacter limnophilus TaxID=1932778 RepID=A0A437MVS7_9SPHI|nr:hypothetical protein [Mucilaginibacter limnophilus]RVU01743.1 hypothetical protein EOD41_07225 [Mucilaginibacter limnophilus]
MKKPSKDAIPVSVLRDTTVVADFEGLNGEGKILYLTPKCVLIGLDGIPHTLFVTSNFYPKNLLEEIGQDLFEVRQLILQPTFSNISSGEAGYGSIPDWITNLKKVELIKFAYINLDELWLLRDLPVKQMVLNNIKFSETDLFIKSVNLFHFLDGITYDDSISKEIISRVMLRKSGVKFSYKTD